MEEQINSNTNLTDGLRCRSNVKNKNDQNEFLFNEPSIILPHSEHEEQFTILNDDRLFDQSSELNLSDLELNKIQKGDLCKGDSNETEKPDEKQTESYKKRKIPKLIDRNFKFNFQMPAKVIRKTPDKIDEARENFLDSVCNPSKRLQSENNQSIKNKKVKLESLENSNKLTKLQLFLLPILVLLIIKFVSYFFIKNFF